VQQQEQVVTKVMQLLKGNGFTTRSTVTWCFAIIAKDTGAGEQCVAVAMYMNIVSFPYIKKLRGSRPRGNPYVLLLPMI